MRPCKLFEQTAVCPLRLVHRLHKERLGLRVFFNFRGNHVIKPVLYHIPLALYAEGSDTVAGDLGEQSAGHSFDAEGEGSVLDGGLVPDFRKHVHKACGFFRGHTVKDLVEMGGGVAETGRRRHRPFRGPKDTAFLFDHFIDMMGGTYHA